MMVKHVDERGGAKGGLDSPRKCCLSVFSCRRHSEHTKLRVLLYRHNCLGSNNTRAIMIHGHFASKPKYLSSTTTLVALNIHSVHIPTSGLYEPTNHVISFNIIITVECTAGSLNKASSQHAIKRRKGKDGIRTVWATMLVVLPMCFVDSSS